MKISVIVPTHNIGRRSFSRLRNLVYSLSCQDCEIIISDSSMMNQHKVILDTVKDFEVKVIHNPNKEFNKPILYNKALKLASGNYIMHTDADYIFRRDFIESLKKNASQNRLIVKKVYMLNRECLINDEVINSWSFDKKYLNKFGEAADGGCQFASRHWFESCGGYDEAMKGWCGMDNDMTFRAKTAGMEVFWMENSEFVHQWHEIEKNKYGDFNQIKKNWSRRDSKKENGIWKIENL